MVDMELHMGHVVVAGVLPATFVTGLQDLRLNANTISA